MATTSPPRPSYQHRLPRSGLALPVKEKMAKINVPRTRFPALDKETASGKPLRSELENGDKLKPRKKTETSKPLNGLHPSTTNSRKRGGSGNKPKPTKTPAPASLQQAAKPSAPAPTAPIAQLQRATSDIQLKDEDEEPAPDPTHLVELRSDSHFYLPKRRLIHKPERPFTLFIEERHALARLVWLYLLECQLPCKKVSIKSKEGERAGRGVPSYCKQCIFVDGETSIGQPTAVIRYICNNYSDDMLMGSDTSQISQGFSWIHWAVSVLHRDLFYLNDGELRRGVDNMSNTNERVKESLDSVSLYFDMLEKILSSRDYLLGSVAWFCDSAVALILEDAAGLSLDSWPKLSAWLVRVHDQPNWGIVTRG